MRLACSAETEARTFEASGGLPTEEVSAINAPATVAAGTAVAGVSNPGIFGPAIAEALPQGRFLSFENLSHFGPLEAPGVVAAAAVPRAPGGLARAVDRHRLLGDLAVEDAERPQRRLGMAQRHDHEAPGAEGVEAGRVGDVGGRRVVGGVGV